MIMNYVGIGLLFLAILYTGYQINNYLRLRKTMGELLLSLSPSQGQKKYLIIAGGAFVVLLIVVTFNYISMGVSLNFSYSIMVALVIYSTGRFVVSIVELRENGMLGQIKEIPYREMQDFTVSEKGRRRTVGFQLTEKRHFTSLLSDKDYETLKKIMKNKRVKEKKL